MTESDRDEEANGMQDPRRHTLVDDQYKRWVVIEHHVQQVYQVLDDMLAVHERIALESTHRSDGVVEKAAPEMKIAHLDRPFTFQSVREAAIIVMDHLLQMCEAAGYTGDDVLDATRASVLDKEQPNPFGQGWT